VDICLTCHSEQADMMKTAKALHQSVFVQGCGTCHEPHGGDRPKLAVRKAARFAWNATVRIRSPRR
jgi:predicted CXXCH cytochrome family protein